MERLPSDIQDLIDSYESGESLRKLAKQFGTNHHDIAGMLRAHGVGIRPRVLHTVATDLLVRLYESGKSAEAVGLTVGMPANTVRSRLIHAGVIFRPKNSYPANVEPAHAAVRGRKRSLDEACHMALGRERLASGRNSSRHELALEREFAALGIAVTAQRAVGPYNLDFALHELPVAVEVLGGGYGARSRANRSHRMEYIRNAGWHGIDLIASVENGRRRIVDREVTENLVALAQSIGGQPPTPGQHWMVRGKPDTAYTRQYGYRWSPVRRS